MTNNNKIVLNPNEISDYKLLREALVSALAIYASMHDEINFSEEAIMEKYGIPIFDPYVEVRESFIYFIWDNEREVEWAFQFDEIEDYIEDLRVHYMMNDDLPSYTLRSALEQFSKLEDKAKIDPVNGENLQGEVSLCKLLQHSVALTEFIKQGMNLLIGVLTQIVEQSKKQN